MLSGLFGLRGRPSGITIADLIGNSGKSDSISISIINHNASRRIFVIAVLSLDCIASDVSRFASAAFQTIKAVPELLGEKEETAWSAIKTYYAAFYAGQAVMRLFGESLSYFDRNHTTRILALAAALTKTPTFPITASAYHCWLDAHARCISGTPIRRGAGGAHEAFWFLFGGLLGKLSGYVLQGTLSRTDAQTVFSKIDILRTSISAYNAPLFSELSVVRNDIQYRHNHGVWLPCSVRRHERELLGRLADQWNRDPIYIKISDCAKGGSILENL